MDDTYLRRVLQETAATTDCPIADSDRIISAVRTRHRRRFAVGGVAALAVLAGVALGVSLTRADPAGPATLIPAASSSPAASTAPSARFTGKPSWLPSGSRLVNSAHTPANLTYLFYSLPGDANANNIPVGGATEQNYASIHPATEISIISTLNSGSAAANPTADAPALAGQTVETVNVTGHPATLTYPSDPTRPGVVQVQWLARGTLWTVRCPRGHTPDGLSGVGARDILHIAESLNT
jgi:hypothetical protein